MSLTPFISGAVTFGFWTAGLFFLKFWKKSRDRLFAFFAASFWLMAIEHVVITMTGGIEGSQFYVYVIRLIAFLLIIIAVVDKNRSQ